jgi:hypothetical protein
MTKVSQITEDEFIANVTTTNPELVKKIPNANEVIKAAYKEYANYSVQTATGFAMKKLRKAETDGSAKDEQGIIFGAREVVGDSGKGPTVYGLLQGKKGKEIQSWHGMVDLGDKKIKIPQNAAASIKVVVEDYEGRKSYWITNVFGRKPYTREEILAKITEWGAAIELEDIQKLVKITNPPPVVVVKMTLANASAMSKYGSKEKQPIYDKSEKAEGPRVSLRSKKTANGITAWVRITAPKMGTGITPIEIEDFVELCKESIEKYDNPEDQAAWVGGAIDERRVIVIGSVSSIKGDTDNGYTVNINALAILEGDVIGTTSVKQGQQTLTPEEPETPVEEAPILNDTAPVVAPVAATPVVATVMAPLVAPVEAPVAATVAAPVVDKKLEKFKKDVAANAKKAKELEEKEAREKAEKEAEKETEKEAEKVDSVDLSKIDEEAKVETTEVNEEEDSETSAIVTEIEDAMLFIAGVVRKKPNGEKILDSDPREVKVEALKTLKFDDLYNKLGLNKYPQPVVEQIYEDVTGIKVE